METKPLEFSVPDDVPLPDVIRHLESLPGVKKTGARELSRIFYDTFDWRLYRKGSVLEAREEHDGTHLLWRELRSYRSLGQMATEVPRFVWDLPPSPMRDRLESILEMRGMLPLVRVRTRSEPLEVRDRNGKLLVRAFVEQHLASAADGGDDLPLTPRVRVSPVKGYAKSLERIVVPLEQQLGPPATAGDVFDEALSAIGRTPLDYSSKIRVELRPEMPALEATKTLLGELFHTMLANEAGTVADLDSEFLHDFRVSVRRTRSALSQIKGVIPQEALERFRPEFAWLGSVTGPTRDMDVYLLEFPDYKNGLPPASREALEPLHDFLVARKKAEHDALGRELRSHRYKSLVRTWRAFLEDSGNGSTAAPCAERPIEAVASERIWKVFRRTVKEGDAIDDRSPPEMLHELRKTCKKLRYLLEFFQSLYAKAPVAKLVKALKLLQDNLGEFQDLQVHSEALAAFSRQMTEEGRGAPEETLLAMGMLVERLLQRQQRAREAFQERFAKFSRPKNRELFTQLFAPRRSGVPSGP